MMIGMMTLFMIRSFRSLVHGIGRKGGTVLFMGAAIDRPFPGTRCDYRATSISAAVVLEDQQVNGVRDAQERVEHARKVTPGVIQA